MFGGAYHLAGGEAGIVTAHLWTFTDCFVLTPTSFWSATKLPRAARGLPSAPDESLVADDVVSRYKHSARIARSAILSVAVKKNRALGRAVGLHTATFELTDQETASFTYIYVRGSNVDEFVRLMRVVLVGGRVIDER